MELRGGVTGHQGRLGFTAKEVNMNFERMRHVASDCLVGGTDVDTNTTNVGTEMGVEAFTPQLSTVGLHVTALR